jgi:MFS family permease
MIGGKLSDSWSKPNIMGGFQSNICHFDSIPLAYSSLWFLVIIRILQGAVFSVFSIAPMSMVADLTPSNRLGESMGYYTMISAFSEALSPNIAIKLFKQGGSSLLFATCSGFLVLCSLLSRLFQRDNKPTTTLAAKRDLAADTPYAKGVWVFFEKSALPPAIIFGFFSMGLALILNYIPLYVTQANISNYSLFYILEAIVMTVTRATDDRLIDRIGAKNFFFQPFFQVALPS